MCYINNTSNYSVGKVCLGGPELCLYTQQMFDIGYSGIKHVLKPISPGRGLFFPGKVRSLESAGYY